MYIYIYVLGFVSFSEYGQILKQFYKSLLYKPCLTVPQHTHIYIYIYIYMCTYIYVGQTKLGTYVVAVVWVCECKSDIDVLRLLHNT